MFSSVTPAASKLFFAPETSESMIAVFHLAWTMAIRNPEPTKAISGEVMRRCARRGQSPTVKALGSSGTFNSSHRVYPGLENRLDGKERKLNVYGCAGDENIGPAIGVAGKGGMS